MFTQILNSIPDDQFRAVLSFLIMLPIGWFMKLLKSPQLRLIYSLVIGILLQYYIYSWKMLHVFIAAIINLIIIKLSPPTKVGKIALIYNFTHNSLIHLYRLFFEYDSWSIEISVIFMMVMCKFSGFAYAYQDYYMHTNNLLSIPLNEQQKKYMIENNFSTYEYFSYVYFVSTSVCGPFVEYNDFLNFIYMKEQYKNIPNTILPSIIRLVTGFIFYGLYTGLKEYALPENIMDDEGRFSLNQKIFMYLISSVHEYKYIGGFCLSEAGLIATGISYSGDAEKNGKKEISQKSKDNFSTVRSINVIDLLLVYKPSEFFQNWNISVHIWLKRYVYVRLLPTKGKADFAQKQFASSVTFLVSALWHGFHPTYFVTFFHFYFFTLLETQLVKAFGANSDEKKGSENQSSSIGMKIWTLVCRITVLFILVPFHCLIFVSLDSAKLFKFLNNINYFGTIMVIFPNILLFIYSSVKKGSRNDNKNKVDGYIKQEN